MKKTRIITIISIALILVAIGGYIFIQGMISHKLSDLREIKKEITIADNKFFQLRNQNQLLYQKGNKSENFLNTLFLSEDEVVQFIESIEGIDSVLGTKTSISKIEEQVNPNTKNKEISLSITSTGTFDQLLKMNKLLENMPLEVSFTSNNLNKEVSAEGEFLSSWKLTSDIIIHTYKSKI